MHPAGKAAVSASNPQEQARRVERQARFDAGTSAAPSQVLRRMSYTGPVQVLVSVAAHVHNGLCKVSAMAGLPEPWHGRKAVATPTRTHAACEGLLCAAKCRAAGRQ